VRHELAWEWVNAKQIPGKCSETNDGWQPLAAHTGAENELAWLQHYLHSGSTSTNSAGRAGGLTQLPSSSIGSGGFSQKEPVAGVEWVSGHGETRCTAFWSIKHQSELMHCTALQLCTACCTAAQETGDAQAT